MARFNSFRLFLLSVLCAAAYFIYFDSENFQIRFRRQSPLELIGLPRECTTDAMMALTVDDGPVTDGKTKVIYDQLQAFNMKATFHFGVEYLSNSAVQLLIKSAYQMGHTVGMRWPNSQKANTMADEDFKATLKGYADRMKAVIGKYPRFVRFPNENVEAKHVTFAQELGFTVTFYAVDAGDYAANANHDTLRNKVQEIVNMGATSVLKGSYIILGQHTTALGEGIQGFYTQFNGSYKFATLDQCLATTPTLDAIKYTGSGTDKAIDNSGNPATVKTSGASTRASFNLPVVVLALIAVLFFQF